MAFDAKGNSRDSDGAVDANRITSPSKRIVSVDAWYWLPSKARALNLHHASDSVSKDDNARPSPQLLVDEAAVVHRRVDWRRGPARGSCKEHGENEDVISHRNVKIRVDM